MTFQMAFHKYSCHCQDVLKTHASGRQWVDEEISFQLPNGTWQLVSRTQPVATVFKNGRVLIH